jgi:hypothetical protein
MLERVEDRVLAEGQLNWAQHHAAFYSVGSIGPVQHRLTEKLSGVTLQGVEEQSLKLSPSSADGELPVVDVSDRSHGSIRV